MISRRQLLFTVASLGLLQHSALAVGAPGKQTGWDDFLAQMDRLAELETSGRLSHRSASQQGIGYLSNLDISSTTFLNAIEASYESGNNFWLWQRLVKKQNLNGGILNIYNDKTVQLHDHPGAIGMLRIISGEAEVWQYNEGPVLSRSENTPITELDLVSRRILKPGDTAILTPEIGNIHALRAVTEECRMLDFFIPPYRQSRRSWFEPVEHNWSEMKKLVCRKIPHSEFTAV